MQKLKAVIFDCDGVMFDSREANIHYYNFLLDHFGLPPMGEKKIDFVHVHTAEESIRFIFQGTAFGEKALAYKRFVDYTPFIHDMKIEPGLIALLDRLKPDYRLAVATNRSDTIEKVLALHHLQEYFDIVVSSLDVKNPKPHPECLFKILDFFKIKPEQAIYIGDSSVDHETARAAKVPFIAYKNSELNALILLHSFSELIDSLDRLRY